MPGSSFNEEEFLLAVVRSKARALLIGRRALIAIGIPVLTSDYDFWVHPDDVHPPLPDTWITAPVGP